MSGLDAFIRANAWTERHGVADLLSVAGRAEGLVPWSLAEAVKDAKGRMLA